VKLKSLLRALKPYGEAVRDDRSLLWKLRLCGVELSWYAAEDGQVNVVHIEKPQDLYRYMPQGGYYAKLKDVLKNALKWKKWCGPSGNDHDGFAVQVTHDGAKLQAFLIGFVNGEEINFFSHDARLVGLAIDFCEGRMPAEALTDYVLDVAAYQP
jgi:hypothetical protein